MPVKYCGNCGAKSEGLDVSFCSKCGTRISISSTTRFERPVVNKVKPSRFYREDGDEDEDVDLDELEDIDSIGAGLRGGSVDNARVPFKNVAHTKEASEKGKFRRQHQNQSAEELLKRSVKYSRKNPIDID